MRRVQLHEELIWEILELLWNSPLSTSDRILLMKSSPLVSKSWSTIFAKITLRDVHIPSAGYLHHYMELTQLSSTFYIGGNIPDDICKSITIEPQEHPGETISNLLHEISVKRTHTNPRTLRLVYDKFCIEDIFDIFQFVNFPDSVKGLEVYFIEGARNLGDETFRHLADLKFDKKWPSPRLRQLSMFGGDERLLQHYLRALELHDMTILETDFVIYLENIDFRESCSIPPNLKYRLRTRN